MLPLEFLKGCTLALPPHFCASDTGLDVGLIPGGFRSAWARVTPVSSADHLKRAGCASPGINVRIGIRVLRVGVSAERGAMARVPSSECRSLASGPGSLGAQVASGGVQGVGEEGRFQGVWSRLECWSDCI